MANINGNKRDNTLTGTQNADVMNGRNGNDKLFGLGGNDTLKGGGGNDTLEGGAGDDRIIGGRGTDTAVFSGNRRDYTVTDLGSGLIEISGPDGTDIVSETEYFQFADMTLTASDVLRPLQANLTASSLTVADTTLSPGEGTGVSFHLSSNGANDAAASSYELLIATAPDESAVVSVADTQIASAMQTGDTDILTASIAADTLAPGTYWVAVRVDAGNAIDEENEADNLTQWVQITVEAPVVDLRLTSATVNANSDLELGEGGQIIVDYAIENASNTNDPSDYRIVAFLSRDGTISADDIQIAETSGQLFAGGSTSGQLVGALAEDTGDGDWQVLTRVEWAGGDTDATPQDNVAAETVTLNAARADMALNGATLAARTDLDLNGGGEIQMTYDYANQGTTTPSYFKIRSYLSTDDQISADDKPILGITGGTFTGQSSSVTTSHYFQSDFTPGTYYIISEISWGDNSADADISNNVITQQVTFTAPTTDLAIDAVTLDPGSDLLLDDDGINLQYSVDISNAGGIEHTASLTAWLSTDTNISADDIQFNLGTVTLGVGGTVTVPVDSLLAPDLSGGDYTLIVALTTPDDNASNSIFYLDVPLEEPEGPPVVSGTDGDDLLTGTAEAEVILALAGDDTVVATTGFDDVDGGDGMDTADFSALSSGIGIFSDYGQGPDVLALTDLVTYGTEAYYRNFEEIIATDFDDLISLFDTQVQRLELGAGDDVAEGSALDDVINGGAGNDSIAGYEGDDLITLGEGADYFGVIRYADSPFPSGHGNDTITDFDVTEDLIVFQIEFGETYDPFADMTQSDSGALISYIDGSSILLEGVDMADLTVNNFSYDDTIYVFA